MRLIVSASTPRVTVRATAVERGEDVETAVFVERLHAAAGLASVHKDLRLCDLCKELAFRTQRADRKNGSSYNSFAFSTLCRQFLERACCEMSRRDGAIVAWHEVPGTGAPESTHQQKGESPFRTGTLACP